MAEKKVKRELKEEDVKMFNDWKSAFDVVLQESQKKKEALDFNIANLELKIKQLEEENRRKEREFDIWKRQELQAFENEKTKVMQELDKKLHAVDFGIMEHTKRMQDLEQRELNVKGLEDKQHKLSLDRIEVENLSIKHKELRKDAQTKLATAEDKLSKAAELEKRNNEEFNRIKSVSEKLNKELDEFQREKKSFIEEQKNFEEIRKSVEPKISEFKKLEDSIKKEKSDLETKIKELNEKIIEEKKLFDELSAEKKILDDKKRELNQREEEIKRKAILNG